MFAACAATCKAKQMQNVKLQQNNARKQAKHYENDYDFACMFDGNSFVEEVHTDTHWMGFIRDANGLLQLDAEYKYDELQCLEGTGTSGWGWAL